MTERIVQILNMAKKKKAMETVQNVRMFHCSQCQNVLTLRTMTGRWREKVGGASANLKKIQRGESGEGETLFLRSGRV